MEAVVTSQADVDAAADAGKQQQQPNSHSSPSIPNPNFPQQQQQQQYSPSISNPNFPPQQQQQQQMQMQTNRSHPHPVNMNRQASQFTHFPQSHRSSAVAIGVPANMPDSSPSPARPSMIGSQLRPAVAAAHTQRPLLPPSNRPPPPSSINPQNFQGHTILRAPSVTLTNTPSPSTSQSQQSPHQPWLSARPPLPSQSFRPQVPSASLQQRSHTPQQSLQPMPASSLPQQPSASSQQQQLQFSVSNQSQENGGQQLASPRVPQPLANPQHIARVHGSSNQRPPSPGMGQVSNVGAGLIDKTGCAEPADSFNRILSKRSIQELVTQVDPLEKLDSEVEDVLVDIAEDFIDSVTTFGCSLAKHRKSNMLEAKDILLHLDRTWNMTLPGFGGDEIKTFKKPVANDIHKERLAVIKKSLTGGEVNKSSAGHAAGNVKGHLARSTPNVIGS